MGTSRVQAQEIRERPVRFCDPHEAIGYRADRGGGSPGRVRRGSGAYRLTCSDHSHRELGSNVDPGAVTTRRSCDGVRPRRPENGAVRWGRNE